MDNEKMPEKTGSLTEDIGGVQGTQPSDPQADDAEPQRSAPKPQQAPDAGEIEWAGQVIKKPPSPTA